MKESTESLSHRFDRIVIDNLKKRHDMFKLLMKRPIPTDMFYESGSGLKTIFKELGRVQDFKGIYGFMLGTKLVFIDESSYVLRRVLRQFKGNTKYQRNLFNIILESREDADMISNMLVAEIQLQRMRLVFLEIPDDLERELTYIYLKCQYDCKFNRYK